MARRTLLLIASILVAALGTALIWLYVQGADTRAEAGQAQVEVLVAANEVPAGVAASQVQPIRRLLPQAFVASLGQSVLTQLPTSGYTQTLIVKGLPLVASQFGAQAASPPPAVAGLGGRQIAMKVTMPDPQRLAGLLQAGTRVRVYAAVQDSGAKDKGVVTLFNSVPVLGLAAAANGGSNGTAPQADVTLGLSPEQAKSLALALFRGGGSSLWLGLLGSSTVPDDPRGKETQTTVSGGQ